MCLLTVATTLPADEYHVFDDRIFREAAGVSIAGVWPLSSLRERHVITPMVKDGIVTGIFENSRLLKYSDNETIPLPASSFAVNIRFLLLKRREEDGGLFRTKGNETDPTFLPRLGITQKMLQPLAANCSDILVW